MRAATVRGPSRSPTAGVFWSGRIRKYGLLNGTAGNYFSTPDSVAVSIAGDIDIRVRAALADWTPSANQVLIGKWGLITNRSCVLFVTATTGVLGFTWTADGSTNINAVSTAAPTVADNGALFIRVTLDVDNGAASRVVTFYTSEDGVSWVQLGNAMTGAVTSVFDSTAPWEIGSIESGTLSLASGRIYRAQIYDGIGGTLKADFNPALYTSGTTFTASTGEVWTLNGSAKILVQEL